MKNLVLVAFAALALAAMLPAGAMADTACTVTVTKFNQSYPYSGKATVEYTVGGTLPATAFAEITLRADSASATFIQSNIVVGANSHVIDFALLGGVQRGRLGAGGMRLLLLVGRHGGVYPKRRNLG